MFVAKSHHPITVRAAAAVNAGGTKTKLFVHGAGPIWLDDFADWAPDRRFFEVVTASGTIVGLWSSIPNFRITDAPPTYTA